MPFFSRAPSAAFRAAIAFSALVLASGAQAQGSWPKADCAALSVLGSPQPAWLSAGANAPATESLLTMLNYQMALSICQQDEIIRLLKANAGAAQTQSLALERALAKTRSPEPPKDSALTTSSAAPAPALPALLTPAARASSGAAVSKSPLADLCSAALPSGSSCPSALPATPLFKP